METFVLKHFDTDLLTFTAKDMGEYPEIHIVSINKNAEALLPYDLTPSDEGVSHWLRRRKLPKNRIFAHTILAKFGVPLNRTLEIMKVSKGLSLNDCYWVVPNGFTKTFKECTLYAAKFSKNVSVLALTGYGSSIRRSFLSTPELTTHGMLPKCWRRESGHIYLYKCGTEGSSNTGMEPYSEFYAAQIAEILGISSVPYTLTKWKEKLCSKCELFTNTQCSFISAGRVVKHGGMQAVIDFYKTCGEKYTAALEDMLVYDAVIANTDRHLGNFGFLVDAKTNMFIGPAPLFDHGNSLFSRAAPAECESYETFLSYTNQEYPALYSDFFTAGKKCVRKRHHEGLRRLCTCKLKKHPRYNLDKKRLRLIEYAIWKRAERLLQSDEAGPCELVF